MKDSSPGTSSPWRSGVGLAALCTIGLLTLSAPKAMAQSVAQRTPNLSNGWTPVRGVVQFNFTHRFDISDAPLRKLTNTPSFHVATGVAGPLSVGFIYGSNSDLVWVSTCLSSPATKVGSVAPTRKSRGQAGNTPLSERRSCATSVPPPCE